MSRPTTPSAPNATDADGLPPLERGSDADDLRERMASVRSSLASDVAEVQSATSELTDWRYYVRQHPLAVAGAAAALGYLLVPRRTEVIKPSAAELAKLARRDKVYVSNKPQKASKDRSLLDRGLSIAGAFAARAATAYVSQQLGRATGKTAADANEG